MARSAADLTPHKALIWRVVHRDNLLWILDHGLHCANGSPQDPTYVQIGLPDLIAQRREREVPVPPGGNLSDYVPFYFTPFSPMVLRIITGKEVLPRPRDELCFLVTSLHHLAAQDIPFVFADRHAYLAAATFHRDVADLPSLCWAAWQARKFARNPDDPEAFERYQAEALVYGHLPLCGLQGIICYDSATHDTIADLMAGRELDLRLLQRPEWYF